MLFISLSDSFSVLPAAFSHSPSVLPAIFIHSHAILKVGGSCNRPLLLNIRAYEGS